MPDDKKRKREGQAGENGPRKKAKGGVAIPAEKKQQAKATEKKKDDHLAWDGPTNNHKQNTEGYGCLWRHSVPKGEWESHPCNYPLNGFYACSEGDKKALFSKDFLARAKELKYLSDKSRVTGEAEERVRSGAQEAIAAGRRKAETLKVDKYIRQARHELHWLDRDQGWHINVCPQPEPNHRVKKSQPNFYPYKSKTEGGFGAWYPYEHNHHHLIPIGAVEEWVVGKGGDGGVVRSGRVIQTILMSRWNIHNRQNMLLLPQQEIVAEIVGLPAHCPWGVPEHLDYQTSLQEKLRDLRNEIDRALGTEGHPEPAKVKIDLDELSKTLFKKVKKMEAGKQLEAVTFGG